nr:translation initiation factor IF-2-like [Macaca fascicularis]
MVRGPYTGSHAGRGQPGAGRAEETPERGGDARAPSREARVGAAGGAPGLPRGRRRTTKGRGGPPRPRSCGEPGRNAPPPLPLQPKQSEAEGGERCREGGGPGPGGGGAAEGYCPEAAPPPPRPFRCAGRWSERHPGQLAAAKGRDLVPATGLRGAAATERIGGRARRGAGGARRCGRDSLPEVGGVGRKQNVSGPGAGRDT